jgi:small basic protein (TIGR04137 family)
MPSQEFLMSLHRSLKTKPTALNQHRNVLTRAERIERLTEGERFNHSKNSPLGLLKVANRMASTGKKPKKEAAEGEGAEGAAAPAAGAKAAAPAAKGAAAKK